MLPIFINLYKSIRIKRRISKVIKRDDLHNNETLAKSQLIIFGPWLGEVGSELQYWIPYIRKIKQELFPGKRVIVISRGGVESWYKDITEEYIELFHYLTIGEYSKLRNTIVRDAGLEKQLILVSQEKRLIDDIINKNKLKNYFLIHPSTMWKEILSWTEGKTIFQDVLSMLYFKNIERSDKYKNIVDKFNLPHKYLAMKFYESRLFPKTKDNIFFIKHLIEVLTKKVYVVVLNNSQVDNHSSFSCHSNKRVISINNQLKPEINLGIQTEIIRRSSGFLGTNGGFSILPAFVGKPSLNFYSTPLSKFMPTYFQHEMMAKKIFDDFGIDLYTVMSTDSWRYCLNLINGSI